MIDKILKNNIEESQKIILKNISRLLFKNKCLSKKNIKTMDMYINKYISQKDKIEIAMAFLFDQKEQT